VKRWNKRATPLLVGRRRGECCIAVWCPFCRKYHEHGWDPEYAHAAEHRGAHCRDKNSPFHEGGYYIAEEPENRQPRSKPWDR
jgi:hypothetical protein